jgi:SWIM zinc finger/Reverse transcriptase-like
MAGGTERDASGRFVGPGLRVYVASALALTEPGPAAAGIVVTDEKGRMLAHRAQYLGRAGRSEATARALLVAMQFAIANAMQSPVFKVEDDALTEAVGGDRTPPDQAAPVIGALREAASQLPGLRIETVNSTMNLARPVALAPLVEWLPERTRRAEHLRVRSVGEHTYEVESESQPGQVYRVALRLPDGTAEGEPIQCECADFQYRGIPCKHLLAVVREADALERLFYSEPAGTGPGSSDQP